MDRKMTDFGKIGERRLSDVEKEAITIKLEKSKLNRETSTLILNKGILIYLAFVVIGFMGYKEQIITQNIFYFMVLFGLIILFVAISPYINAMRKEREALDELLNYLFR